MRRGLGPPDLDGIVIHMHLPGVLGGRRQGRQVTYLAGVVHGSDVPVSQERARDFAFMFCHMGTRDGLDGHPHVPNQTEENPSKLKLHTEFWFPTCMILTGS